MLLLTMFSYNTINKMKSNLFDDLGGFLLFHNLLICKLNNSDIKNIKKVCNILLNARF